MLIEDFIRMVDRLREEDPGVKGFFCELKSIGFTVCIEPKGLRLSVSKEALNDPSTTICKLRWLELRKDLQEYDFTEKEIDTAFGAGVDLKNVLLRKSLEDLCKSGLISEELTECLAGEYATNKTPLELMDIQYCVMNSYYRAMDLPILPIIVSIGQVVSAQHISSIDRRGLYDILIEECTGETITPLNIKGFTKAMYNELGVLFQNNGVKLNDFLRR